MIDKLRHSGIDTIGDIPWGSHLSYLYEKKEDFLDLIVQYLKIGLENNEFCICITSDYITREDIEETMNTKIEDFSKYLETGKIDIISYKDFYTHNDKISINKIAGAWEELYNRAIEKGFEGVRALGDECWVKREQWKDFIEYEELLNKIIWKSKAITMRTYYLNNLSSSDIIDIVQCHQSVLMCRNNRCTLVEGTTLKYTREKLERANRLYSVLSKINHAIVRIQEPKTLYREACRIAVEDGLFRIAWIGKINEVTGELEPKAQWGLQQDEQGRLLKNYESHGYRQYELIAEDLSKGEPYICHDIHSMSEPALYEDLVEYKIQSFAVFPLKIDKRIVGIMAFYSTEASFTEEEEINVLNSLCDDLSFVIKSIEKEKIRTLMETELRQSEERYRKIFELSPTAILVHSQFIIENANLAAAKLLGAEKPDTLIGNSILDYIHKDYHYLVIDRRRKIKRYGEAMPFEEEKYIKLDGTVIDVEATGAIFPYKDKNAMVSVVRDITETKKLEQLKKASEENRRLLDEAKQYDLLKTEFFANLSHELRTPINVILSAIQLLNLYIGEDSIDNNDNIGKYIYTMQQNCYRLLRLVCNIIDMTKIDTGFFELELENYNIVDVVEDITLSVSEYVEYKGIELVFDTDVEEKAIACDSDKIERIMLNLLSNAVKFTEIGGKINVNVYDQGDKVIISVKDSGIGIPKEKQKFIFERFHQVDKSLTRNHEGSGIGLSIVKSLVELHGGTIRVHSEFGKGTEFIIELPVRFVKSNEIAATSTSGDYFEKVNIEFSDLY